MGHLLYLIFRCDRNVMESLDFGGVFEGSKHTLLLFSFFLWAGGCSRPATKHARTTWSAPLLLLVAPSPSPINRSIIDEWASLAVAPGFAKPVGTDPV